MTEPARPAAEVSTDAARMPAASDLLHRDGVRAFCAGECGEAQRLFQQATLINPANLEILKDLGHAHLHLGQTGKARELYTRAWECGARFPDLAHNLALLLLDAREHAEAAKLLRAVIDLDFTVRPGRFYLGLLYPSSAVFMAECCLLLGVAVRERGRVEAAIEHLNRAIELNPRLISAHQLLAECHAAERRWDRVVERCRDLLALLPTGEEIASARILLANALFESGHAADALRELEGLLARDPDNADARFHLQSLAERMGESAPRRRMPHVDAEEIASPLFGLTAPEPLAPGLEETELQIIGQSPAMRRVLRYARLAAASNSTVLLTGENGTGKELIARAIYLYSPRRDGPMIAVNCAALPETLLESELFGHERGSFTGALAQKKGRFELAHGGTLFLDEVGEMSLALQVKLLRVLQEREFERVGGTESIHVDVRIIAATNQDLERLVEEKRFREDLYFRLKVIPIKIPPLRERREDIRLLVEHFARRASGGRGPVRVFTDEEVRILESHRWPGNVRELENFIERAVVMGHSGQQIIEEFLALRHREPVARPAAPDDVFQIRLGASLEEIETAYIEQVLRETGGNQRRACEILGINPSTLWRKTKRGRSGRDVR